MKTISVITPCFNEEANVRDCYESVRSIFDRELRRYRREHIFCDNASTDGTLGILRELASLDSDIKVIVNARNFGPLRSTYNGVMAASGDAVVLFLPADLQDPPELVPEFVNRWEEGYEIVYGIRASREEGWLMRTVRNLYYRGLTRFSQLDVPPGVGDFQLADRRIIEAMRSLNDCYPFMRMMTFECGGKAIGVPYRWRARRHGASKNRLAALVDQGMNGIVSFTGTPLRLGLYAGFTIATVSICYAAINFVIGVIYYRQFTQPGIMTLITALFFFSGVQLFFMGLLGEYILAIYGQVRAKPVVFERLRINFAPPEEGRGAAGGD